MISNKLTKSLFQLALSCPTKLYYAAAPEYVNRSLEDSFLASLAEGGFQVGALATCYYPDGHDLGGLSTKDALEQTAALLKQKSVVIFEAAIQHGNLLVRTDILVKRGSHLELIEVKAKSFDPAKDSFFGKRGGLLSGWKPYLYDVAFQKHVLLAALPGLIIKSFLMLVDKSALCPVDGLNQMFRISKDAAGRSVVQASKQLNAHHLTPFLLTRVPADNACALIFSNALSINGTGFTFSDGVSYLAEHYCKHAKIISPLSSACQSCEFQADENERDAGLLSGFRECWQEALGYTDADFEDQTVLELWNFRRKDQLIQEGIIKLDDVQEEHINPKAGQGEGLSTSQRQWLQVSKYQDGDPSAWVDLQGLRKEMASWRFPLHFIDFETSMAAIPFNKGRHPYEGIAFQFSHHVVEADGSIRHAGEYLSTKAGAFPNYDFIRRLKQELEQDDGTIFRYAAHENTFLNIIHQQLQSDPNPVSDAGELCAFIETITASTKDGSKAWTGPRNMVDMLEIIKKYYYHPATRGSNSIKYVLPAVLSTSDFLQNKYSIPIYGADPTFPDAIKSHNFTNWTWVIRDDKNQILNPYTLLPPLFCGDSPEEDDLISHLDEIRDGGAALTAYAKLQFEDMSDPERTAIEKALKKYCELDTLAMVFLYEEWKHLCS